MSHPPAPRRPAVPLPPRVADAAAALAGLILPLGFAPFSVFPVAVLSPAVLFALWQGVSPRRAAWLGFVFGAGMFAAGVSWVYVSLHEFGNMAAPLAVVTVVIFVVLMAAFPAMAGWAQAWLGRGGGLPGLVLAPAAMWSLTEWLRGWALSGFPWLSLGYSQVNSPLAGLAPLGGVYGVGLAVALSAGVLAAAFSMPGRKAAGLLLAAGLAWLLAEGLQHVSWTQPQGKPLGVAMVQGNIPLERKWQPSQRDAIIEHYLSLSETVAGTELILWPEAAIPGFVKELDGAFWARLRRLTQNGSSVMFGALERDSRSAGQPYYNAVLALGPDGRQTYRKRHLVPFGEYLPMTALLGWLIDYLHIPMSDFSAWRPTQRPLSAAGVPLGVSICYEDAFPAEVRRMLPAANVLANFSEDAWFGDSIGPRQRLDMARMRALESGRPMLRVANTGISAAFDEQGAEIARTRQFVVDVLRVTVQPRGGATPYVRVGDAPVIVLALVLALLGRMLSPRSKKEAGTRR